MTQAINLGRSPLDPSINLQELPPDPLAEIARHLRSPEDWREFGLVCRAFRVARIRARKAFTLKQLPSGPNGICSPEIFRERLRGAACLPEAGGTPFGQN